MDYTLFSSVSGTFTKIVSILGHNQASAYLEGSVEVICFKITPFDSPAARAEDDRFDACRLQNPYSVITMESILKSIIRDKLENISCVEIKQ